jgi:hypothetical protein
MLESVEEKEEKLGKKQNKAMVRKATIPNSEEPVPKHAWTTCNLAQKHSRTLEKPKGAHAV